MFKKHTYARTHTKPPALFKKDRIFWIALYCPLLHFNIRTGLSTRTALCTEQSLYFYTELDCQMLYFEALE